MTLTLRLHTLSRLRLKNMLQPPPKTFSLSGAGRVASSLSRVFIPLCDHGHCKFEKG